MKYPITLMIIDDDDDDRTLFKEAVHDTNKNYQCLEGTDGENALEILENLEGEFPDIIFLDLNMPGISGKQCLRKLKDSRKFGHIPVVIYSTSKRAEDYDETRRIGAFNFIIKPSTFNGICKMITDTLSELKQKNLQHH